jgi:hypothetical protein
MKRTLLFVFLVSSLFTAAQAQTPIVNGDFENWINDIDIEPAVWQTNNNYFSHVDTPDVYVSVVSGAVNSAIHIETLNSQGGFPFPGFMTNGQTFNGTGGVPYTGATIPTQFTGMYNYNIQGNDTAEIYIVFKKNAAVIGSDTFRLSGSQSTYTSFSFPLQSLPMVPDSLIIAIFSGIYPSSTAAVGNFIELDELGFSDGTTTSTFLNSSFDQWSSTTIIYPYAWYLHGSVGSSTDSHSGSYSVKLETKDNGTGVEAGSLTSPQTAISSTGDTLTGYYKYIPAGNDQAGIILALYNTTTGLEDVLSGTFAPVSTYTFFSIPLNSTVGASVMDFTIFSSQSSPVAHSTLYLDDVAINGQPVTGISNVQQHLAKIYPNPAKDVLHISLQNQSAPVHINIFNTTGVLVSTVDSKDKTGIAIPVQQLPSGLYFCEVRQGTAIIKNAFMKE